MFSLLSTFGTLISSVDLGAMLMAATGPLQVFEEGLKIMKMVMTVMGGIAVIWGGFQVFEGYQSDNAGSKSSGTKWLVGGGGIAVIAQVLIPLMANQLTLTP